MDENTEDIKISFLPLPTQQKSENMIKLLADLQEYKNILEEYFNIKEEDLL